MFRFQVQVPTTVNELTLVCVQFFNLLQRSVLGPILYILFTADLPSILAKHQTKDHLYADDVQSLIHGLPSEQIHLVERINSVSRDLHFWMMQWRLYKGARGTSAPN